MQRLEVSGAVRPIYGSLGVKRLIEILTNTLYGFLFHAASSINIYVFPFPNQLVRPRGLH